MVDVAVTNTDSVTVAGSIAVRVRVIIVPMIVTL